MSEEMLVFNGINAATGDYLLPPMTPKQVATIVQGQQQDEAHIQELKWWYQRVSQTTLGPKEGVNPKDLAEAGWGVIFAYKADPHVREALKELLDHRKEQATKKKERYYQEYTGERAYRPGESKANFLKRQGVGPGPADPDKVPYYLLITLPVMALALPKWMISRTRRFVCQPLLPLMPLSPIYHAACSVIPMVER